MDGAAGLTDELRGCFSHILFYVYSIMQVIELKSTAEFLQGFPLIKQLNPSLTKPVFKHRLKAMRAQGYRCIAMIEKGQYIAISGFWHSTRFWCGDFIEMDNLVVKEGIRSKGIGKKLVNWIEKEAKRKGCDVINLNCYVSSYDAHRFYAREGFIIKGYHFMKSL
jgi:GNAT superfamily N-acetyltransferase